MRLLPLSLYIDSKKNLFLIFFLINFIQTISSQNLVTNGSFENHGEVTCIGCYNKTQFESVMANWSFINWLSPYICNRDYNIYEQGICNLKDYKPRDGKTCVELVHFAEGSDCNDKGGWSNYLQSKLKSPLRIGKVYKISFSVNIFGKTSYPSRSEYAKFIGIDFTEKIFQPSSVRNACTLFSSTPFIVDTILADSWIDKVFYIRPTLALSYIQIGVFYNSEWTKNSGFYHQDGRFAIDAIEVKELIDANNINKDKIIDYPNQKFTLNNQANSQTVKIKEFNNKILLFDLSSNQLSPASKDILDSVGAFMKLNKYRTVLDINGFTDFTGSIEINEVLSINRAKSVFDYLQNMGAPFYCMNIKGNGALKPLESNISEEGREKNRRVEISISEYPLASQYYFYADFYTKQKNLDSAFFFLNLWVKENEAIQDQLAFVDDDLNSLKSDLRWKKIYNQIKEGYKVYKQPDYAFQLDSLYFIDQQYRSLNNYFYFEKKSIPKRFDTVSIKGIQDFWGVSDKSNLDKLEVLLKRYNWPKISEVGKRPSKTAFYIIMHSNIENIKKYIPIVEERCKAKEAEWECYANMFDRIQKESGKPQKYGTQYIADPKDSKHYILYKLENENLIDEFRKSIYLNPLSVKEYCSNSLSFDNE